MPIRRERIKHTVKKKVDLFWTFWNEFAGWSTFRIASECIREMTRRRFGTRWKKNFRNSTTWKKVGRLWHKSNWQKCRSRTSAEWHDGLVWLWCQSIGLVQPSRLIPILSKLDKYFSISTKKCQKRIIKVPFSKNLTPKFPIIFCQLIELIESYKMAYHVCTQNNSRIRDIFNFIVGDSPLSIYWFFVILSYWHVWGVIPVWFFALITNQVSDLRKCHFLTFYPTSMSLFDIFLKVSKIDFLGRITSKIIFLPIYQMSPDIGVSFTRHQLNAQKICDSDSYF